jgi:hypothetical protein
MNKGEKRLEIRGVRSTCTHMYTTTNCILASFLNSSNCSYLSFQSALSLTFHTNPSSVNLVLLSSVIVDAFPSDHNLCCLRCSVTHSPMKYINTFYECQGSKHIRGTANTKITYPTLDGDHMTLEHDNLHTQPCMQ